MNLSVKWDDEVTKMRKINWKSQDELIGKVLL
jgi:hypothetical protein